MEHVTINNAYICYRMLNNANKCYKDADAYYVDTIDCLRMLTAEQRMLTWVTGKFRKFMMGPEVWGGKCIPPNFFINEYYERGSTVC
jgi:hypothetical protein